MKSKAILSLLFLLLVSSSARLLAAEAKPASQVTWENTLAAAKKEGRLNFYVGRYGTAKVFINWFLLRKGQIALQKYDDLYGQEPPNSRRIDIPKDTLPPSSRLVEGRRYLDFTDPKYADMTPIYQLAKEFMKGREGK